MNLVSAILWLACFIIFLVVEIATVSLVSVWFAGGALVAFIVNLMGVNSIWIQTGTFIGVSVVLLAITRPLASRFINRGLVKTNVDEIIGKRVKVIEQINNINETGKVMHNGVEWTARNLDDSGVIEKDSLVEVVEVKGVKLIVKSVV